MIDYDKYSKLVMGISAYEAPDHYTMEEMIEEGHEFILVGQPFTTKAGHIVQAVLWR